MSFACEKNKVIISESEVPPTFTLCKDLSMSWNPREEVIGKFPGEGRLSKDPLFPVAVDSLWGSYI